MPMHKATISPLAMATVKSFEDMVRVLINEGMRAIEGTATFPVSLCAAVLMSNTKKTLHLLLEAEGERDRSTGQTSKSMARTFSSTLALAFTVLQYLGERSPGGRAGRSGA